MENDKKQKTMEEEEFINYDTAPRVCFFTHLCEYGITRLPRLGFTWLFKLS